MPSTTALIGVFLGRQLDLRLHREAQIVVRDDLRVGVAHRGLDRLGHHRAAVDPLQVPDRHLAGAEAVDAHRALELVEARVDLGIEVVWPGPPRGYSRFNPSESVSVTCMVEIVLVLLVRVSLPTAVGPNDRLVRAEGFEPTSLAALEPKSSASASSATPAKGEAEASPRAARLISCCCGRAP